MIELGRLVVGVVLVVAACRDDVSRSVPPTSSPRDADRVEALDATALRPDASTSADAALPVDAPAIAKKRGRQRGAACKSFDDCGDGLDCSIYRTVTGKRVGVCDIRCTPDGTCPAGESCVFAADGPQGFCQPRGY